MKKTIFTLISLALLTAATPAIAENACDENMCPQVPKVSGAISSTLSKITGMNLVLSSILEGQVKKQMDKALSANFKVDIKPFGAKSLLDGKFQKITAQAPSASVEGIYLSNIKAESVCGYNHFVYKDGNVFTAENFLMSFDAEVSSNDVQKLLQTPEYKKVVDSLNVKVGNIYVTKVFDTKAEIKNNRLSYSFRFSSPLTLGQAKLISTSMGLEVVDGKLTFTDIQTNSSIANSSLNAILPIVNKLNPFAIKTAILNNTESSINIKDIKFENNKILIKGLVIVPKNYYN